MAWKPGYIENFESEHPFESITGISTHPKDCCVLWFRWGSRRCCPFPGHPRRAGTWGCPGSGCPASGWTCSSCPTAAAASARDHVLEPVHSVGPAPRCYAWRRCPQNCAPWKERKMDHPSCRSLPWSTYSWRGPMRVLRSVFKTVWDRNFDILFAFAFDNEN